jgi:hypothetical protein
MLMRLRHKKSGMSQIHLLLNVENSESPSPNHRAFQIQPQVMNGVNNTAMAAFYDLYEDGINDIIVAESLNGGSSHRVGAFTNATQDSDAYFVKVIVLSGE